MTDTTQVATALTPLVDNKKLVLIKLDVAELINRAEILEVDDQFTYEIGDELLGELKTAEKTADAERDFRYKLTTVIEAVIMGDVRASLKAIVVAADGVKKKMLAHRNAQIRIDAERQAAADRLAR